MILTNAHTHLELTGLGHLCPSTPVSFVPWIARLAWHRCRRSRAQIRADIDEGIARLQAYGTTYVADVTSTGESIEPLLSSGLRGVVFLEVMGLDSHGALERLERAQAAILRAQRHPGHGPMRVGLSLHAPYSCHPDLLRAGASWCREQRVPLCLHVAESPVEAELLLSGTARSMPVPLRLLVRLVGAWPTHVPHMRPVPYLASLGVLDARPLLIHAVQVTQQDVRTIANSGCAVAHCPRSNHLLGCGRMPLEQYLDAGVTVYLGTDSLASSPSLDVRQEAAFARELHASRAPPDRVQDLLRQPLA